MANLTVVIPTKNEEKTIGKIIDQVKEYAAEVLVIDGHSADKTREIAAQRGARVVLDDKRGKGNAYKVGLRQAGGDIVIFIDGDGSHEIEDIPHLITPIVTGKADLVIASRMLGGSDELHGTITNFVRMVGAGVLALAINYRFGVHLTDPLNGFRAVDQKKILALDLKSDDFDIEHEMIIKALKQGYKIMEMPSHEYERKAGCSKLPTYRGWKFVLRLLKDIW